MPSKKISIFLLLVIISVGIFFRIFHIESMPGGLFPDEAANGLDINLMEQGVLQPFYERGNGREALFFYWQWFWVGVFGRTPLAHHFASALIGIFSLVACYLFSKRLWLYGKETIAKNSITLALLSTFVMATSTWHIVLSRTAFRANLIPLFSALTLWALIGVPKANSLRQKMFWATLAGAFFALGFYSYIAFRILALLVVILVAWPFFAQIKTAFWKNIKTYTLPLLGLLLAFAIFIAPLAHYFYTHPGSFVGRSGQVSVFNPELNKGDLIGTLWQVSKLSMQAYFIDGDVNWRHNISGRPFISPILSPFFAVGLVLVFVQALLYFIKPNRFQYYFPQFLLLGWFLAFLLPVITTAEGIPHGLRAIGTIPAVFIMTAYGAFVLGKLAFHIAKHYPQGPLWLEGLLKKSLLLLVAVFSIAVPIESAAWYFGYSASSEENYYAFRSDLTTVSKYLLENRQTLPTYLVLDKFSVQSVDYMTTVEGKSSCDRDLHYRPATCIPSQVNKPFIQVDPERSYLPVDTLYENVPIWPLGLPSGSRIVFTQSSMYDTAKFRTYHPNSKLIKETQNVFGQTILAVYEIE